MGITVRTSQLTSAIILTMRVLWLFTKWLVVPAVLAAVGYFVLGPKLGDVPAIAHVVDDSGRKQDSKPSNEDSTPGTKHKGEPEVIVVRRPGGSFSPNSRRRSRDGWRLSTDGTRKKKKKRRASTSAPLGPETPPPDTSGSGGGGDTGGSTGGDTGGSTGGIG